MKKAQKYLEKIVNIIMILVVIAIGFCLYNIIAIKVFNKSYINIFGYSFFEVATGSMAGSIETGDAVIVKIHSDYKVGDIITYKVGKDYVTHRIISIEKDKVITKGDSNNTNDKPIAKKDILGRVVKVLPRLSVWKKVLLTPKVIILVFVTLISFSILFAYDGNAIKITMADNSKEGYSKRRNKESRKVLDATQIINIKDIKKAEKTKSNKKQLDATQIININDLKNINEGKEKKKKKQLDATQIINLDDLPKK